jgi:hypothetical protein
MRFFGFGTLTACGFKTQNPRKHDRVSVMLTTMPDEILLGTSAFRADARNGSVYRKSLVKRIEQWRG